MTIKGLEKMLREQFKLSDQQVKFNELKGHDDQYEKGYKDALKMVIDNLKTIPKKEDSIPISWIENWSVSLWMGMSDLVCQKMIEHWRKENGS